MTMEKEFDLQIAGLLKNHTSEIIRDFPPRFSSVCIPILDTAEGPSVLFEVRSGRLNSQPGDICFPGGMAEEGETPEETAVREISEELLIRPEQVSLLGNADMVMIGSLLIRPFAVSLKGYNGTFSGDEVSEVFTVPLKWFRDNPAECYTVNYAPVLPEDFPTSDIRGGAAYKFRPRREKIYFYHYHHYCIWGLTAKILHRFLEVTGALI